MGDPATMTDDALLDEIVETIRMARGRGTWDRERLRAVSAEAKRRNLLDTAAHRALKETAHA